MAPPSWQGHAAAVLSVPLLILVVAPSTTAIGVNYGTKGDNLPPPATVASFLANRTRIDRVKLFDTNPDMVRAFAGTGIAVMVTAGNGDIPKLATKDGAGAWVAANVAPYYPSTDISLVSVGNEIMDTADKALISNLVPAMRALKAALVAAGYPKIRVSTPHSLGILSVSEPPSASRFRDGFDRAVFAPMLAFHRQSRSPFMVNPYPYFGYNGVTLPYALARPNPGVPDPGTGITYTSMFEAQLDSVYSAMKKLGFEDVEIAVGETGWPTKAEDGQIGVSTAEAAEYNRYLIGEASGGSGTPLMPKRTFETYIFALFNENLKPGPVAERNFGLFYANLTPVYDVGLMKDGVKTAATPAPAPDESKAAQSAVKKDDVEAAAAPEETAASASAPGPSSVDGEASSKATGPSPSEAPSQSGSTGEDKTPEKEEGGGDAPPPAASASGPPDEASETAAKDVDAAGGGKTPAPAGAESQGSSNLRVPVSCLLTVALSLALTGGI
ncbi:glucan endo-1,3-beta-glucosidase precursor [Zea mays]|uniref:glucan endo-1,3-beta-D-glucosidase n=1 Tax=Zea mays TaxID=4577 RepID=B6TY63_MAIZE|nr:glucan endo-1,3-beta-glucosidase precursor [Zea mays]ACG42046.1 glucan endo-1,3-beta-glucosidase precursor [Zea mays]ONM52536.1 Glycosyl hydrolase superfamily protein [Zea mays]|eukprot:NP_001151227.1 glucan endo-1,3-beta-glucosidase precursor [Zea mays]